MTSRINKVPTGLQALLGSQNLGQNPSELTGDVRPGVDMFPFWSAYDLTVITKSTNVVVAADTLTAQTFRVPDGEIWYLASIGVQWEFLTAGDSMQLSAHEQFILNGSYDGVGPNSNIRAPLAAWGEKLCTAPGGVASFDVTHFDRLRPLRSRETVNFTVSELVVGGGVGNEPEIRGYLWFYRYRV